MFCDPGGPTLGRVELRLWLDDDDPVSGRLGVDGRHATAFVGWLGLLGLLEGLLVGSGVALPAGDGSRRELAAGADAELGEHV